jgi:hypothetical protein
MSTIHRQSLPFEDGSSLMVRESIQGFCVLYVSPAGVRKKLAVHDNLHDAEEDYYCNLAFIAECGIEEQEQELRTSDVEPDVDDWNTEQLVEQHEYEESLAG